MIRTHMFAVLTAGLLATGCSYTETRAVAYASGEYRGYEG